MVSYSCSPELNEFMDWKSKILTSNLSAVHPEITDLNSLKAALTAKAKSVDLELKRRDVEHLLFHRERAELVTRFPAFVESL